MSNVEEFLTLRKAQEAEVIRVQRWHDTVNACLAGGMLLLTAKEIADNLHGPLKTT